MYKKSNPAGLFSRSLLAIGIGVASLSASVQAQDGGRFVEQVTIVGNQERAAQITGSAYFIGKESLERFAYSDIQRMAREVPGVSIQVEDGFGLRPNISIRGVATERSSRITLLEDNILIAPAPYAAPSAYYFPTAGRMQAIEVVKGPAAITQGPYTIGGALNMVSTAIPTERAGGLVVETGTDNTSRVHASYGGYNESGFGFLLETHQWESDGYQKIDRSNTDTGLDLEDYTVKFAWAPLDSKHSVELKLQRTDQSSNQSYLGLTDADFSANPYRRYGISDLDNIQTEHKQAVLRYGYRFSDSVSIAASLYRNEHARNWYKTEGIDLDGSGTVNSYTSWANIVSGINQGGGREDFNAAQLQAILDGELDTAVGSIRVRSNNREYYSQGLQLTLDWSFSAGDAEHQIEAGIRLHEDEEDRLQYDSAYQQVAGQMVLNSIGVLGGAGNRVQQAEAMAIHIYDQISIGNWLFTPGLRYEDIEQSRTRYTGGANRVYRDSRKNDVQVLLPGLGVAYNLNSEWQLVGGVHKGFTTPSNSPGVKEEEAINYEMGFRVQSGSARAEVMAFLSDYENLLGVCTASSGVDCVAGDAFNGEAATVKGLEVFLSQDLAASDSYQLPVSFSYTWIDGEFDTNIADTAFFGDVQAGDPIPYIPDQQWRLSVGYNRLQWSANLSANYVDEVCVLASCGAFEQTDNSLTFDALLSYQLNPSVSLYAKIENLSSESDIMGRHPYGARPNKDQTGMLGLNIHF